MRMPLLVCAWFALTITAAAQSSATAAPANAAPNNVAPNNVVPGSTAPSNTAPPSAAPGNTALPHTAAPAPATPEPYSYRPDGRRDPFTSLISGAAADSGVLRHGGGLTGFAVNEISVRGVMKSREQLIAMIQGPDNKTYVIHQGDKLADGVVKSVTTDGLVLVQDITDPLSIQKQREVRKLLRSLEEAKE
jgi:Tfp pilus assembly protein PilP